MPAKKKQLEAPEAPPAEDAQPSQNGEGKRPPAHTLRIGRLKGVVWLNESKDGRRHYSVTVARLYRTYDGEWSQSTSFDRGDLLPLAEVLRLAFLWIAANPVSTGSGGDEDAPF